MKPVDVNNLVQYATHFFLGMFLINDGTKLSPVYVEKGEKGWVVRAQLGGMNPWYLNTTHTIYDTIAPGYVSYWRYKRGTAFPTAKDAVEFFNRIQFWDDAKEQALRETNATEASA